LDRLTITKWVIVLTELNFSLYCSKHNPICSSLAACSCVLGPKNNLSFDYVWMNQPPTIILPGIQKFSISHTVLEIELIAIFEDLWLFAKHYPHVCDLRLYGTLMIGLGLRFTVVVAYTITQWNIISGATYPIMGSHSMYKLYNSCIQAHWVRVPVTAFNRDCSFCVCEYLQILYNWLLVYIIERIAQTLTMSPRNRSRYPARGPASDLQTVQFRFRPVQPSNQVLLRWRTGTPTLMQQPTGLSCIARLMDSDARFWFSGCSIYYQVHIPYCWSQKNGFCTSLSFSDVLAACIITNKRDTLHVLSWSQKSMLHQWLFVLHPYQSEWWLDKVVYNWGPNHISKLPGKQCTPCSIPKIRILTVVTMFCLELYLICVVIGCKYFSLALRLLW
jgi:hypothetical protein